MTPNARRRLRYVREKFTKYPEVAVLTAEVAAHMLGLESQHHYVDAMQLMRLAVTMGEDGVLEFENLLSVFPEKHPDDAVIPWVAKQINDVMKAIDAQDWDPAVLGPRNEVPWPTSVSRARQWESDGRLVLNEIMDKLRRRVAAIAQWAREERVDLNRYTLQQALEAIESRVVKGRVGTGKVVYQWPDGWTMQRLGVEDLDAEGQVMQHCIGQGGYDDPVAEGLVEIYSLRDRRGMPHVTIEYNALEKHIKQVMGKQNDPPIEEYAKRVREWIREMMGSDPLGLFYAGDRDALKGAVLDSSDLSNEDFSSVDMTGASLKRMPGCRLRWPRALRARIAPPARLSDADFSQAILVRADLTEAFMSGVNLSGADLRFAKMSQAVLHGANLDSAILQRAELMKADLAEADLRMADLSRADLTEASLLRASLNEADLSNAKLQGVNLIKADLTMATLTEADLQFAKLDSAVLQSAVLDKADLDGASLESADLRSASMVGASLREANLRNANLSYANLTGADLTGADLTGAKLRLADLTRAIGLNLTKAQLAQSERQGEEDEDDD